MFNMFNIFNITNAPVLVLVVLPVPVVAAHVKVMRDVRGVVRGEATLEQVRDSVPAHRSRVRPARHQFSPTPKAC